VCGGGGREGYRKEKEKKDLGCFLSSVYRFIHDKTHQENSEDSSMPIVLPQADTGTKRFW